MHTACTFQAAYTSPASTLAVVIALRTSSALHTPQHRPCQSITTPAQAWHARCAWHAPPV